MGSQKDFQSIFDNFTPEGAEDINSLDLLDRKPIPAATECVSENLDEKLELEKTTHNFGIITFANWFSKYSDRVSSVGPVRINMNGVNPNESIVVTIPNDQGKRFKEFDKRHLKIIENASIIPVIDAEPIDMFVYNNAQGDRMVKIFLKTVGNMDLYTYRIIGRPVGSFLVYLQSAVVDCP